MRSSNTRKQRGSGMFNTLRGFLKGPAPPPRQPTRRLTNRGLPSPAVAPKEHETLLPYTDRIFLFWYSRVNPDKANTLLQTLGSTERYIPIDPSQKKLTPEQKKVLRILSQHFFNPTTKNPIEGFASALLNTDYHAFDKELEEFEATGQPIYDPYKKKWVIAESYAKTLGRLPLLLEKSERDLQYYDNWSANVCAFRPDMLKNSFTTFQSDFCIPILTPSLEAKRQFINSFSHMTNWKKPNLPPNYPILIVKEQFMPKITNSRADKTIIKANAFPTTAWIVDAFRNDGVVDIHHTLAELMKKEAFDLWDYSFWFTVYKISGIENIAFDKEKYMITDNSLFPSKTLYANLNFFIEPKVQNKKHSLLKNIVKAKKVYGFDPMTSLYIRRYLPKEWVNLTKDPNMSRFLTLPFVEQLLICKLQHTAYLKIAFGDICGPTQNNTIVNNSNETPSRKAALLKGMEVYGQNLSDYTVSDGLLNYVDTAEHIAVYRNVLQKF